MSLRSSKVNQQKSKSGTIKNNERFTVVTLDVGKKIVREEPVIAPPIQKISDNKNFKKVILSIPRSEPQKKTEHAHQRMEPQIKTSTGRQREPTVRSDQARQSKKLFETHSKGNLQPEQRHFLSRSEPQKADKSVEQKPKISLRTRQEVPHQTQHSETEEDEVPEVEDEQEQVDKSPEFIEVEE